MLEDLYLQFQLAALHAPTLPSVTPRYQNVKNGFSEDFFVYSLRNIGKQTQM